MSRIPPTIPGAKQSFLTTQTNILSQPIAPSRAWQTSAADAEGAISQRVWHDALSSLNSTISIHEKRVHAPLATRTVAEQIADGYTRDAERRTRIDEQDGESGISQDAELYDEDVIDTLPTIWFSEQDALDAPLDAKRYTELVENAAELNERRRALRERVGRLRKMTAVIEPLRTTDGGVGIQENLVTRNGGVEKELEKMRFLLARVSGRVDQLAGDGVAPKDRQRSTSKRTVDDFLADSAVFPS